MKSRKCEQLGAITFSEHQSPKLKSKPLAIVTQSEVFTLHNSAHSAIVIHST